MMANPKSKILPSIFSTIAIVVLFYGLDVFAPMLMCDLSRFGTNVIGAGLGIVIVTAVCISKHRPLGSIGLIFDPVRILRGFLVGGSMATAPLVILFALKALAYGIFKFESFRPDFVLPNSPDGFSLVSVAVFGASCAASALMQELVFRGFVIRSMRPQYPFLDANVVQAALSVVLPLLTVLRNLVFGHYNHLSGFKKIIFIITVFLFYAVYTFFSSIKRGIVTRVSGDIWPSFFGNFAFLFFGGCLFIQNNMIKTFPPILFLLLAELISLIVAGKYYQKQYVRNVKRKEEHDKKVAEWIEKKRIQENNREADPNIEDLSQKSVEEIMNQHKQKLIESIGSHSQPVHPEKDDSISDFAEVISDKNE